MFVKEKDRLKVKIRKKIFHANSNQESGGSSTKSRQNRL